MSPDGFAILTLAIYVAVAITVVVLVVRRSIECWQVWILHIIARTYSSLMFQQRLRQPCPLPSAGGALVIANHRSPVDPLLIFSSCGTRRDKLRIRPPEFLTATEYTQIGGFIGFVCKHLRTIPVDRDGQDMEGAKIGLRRLQQDRIVGIFPEGRINKGEGLLPANTGVAWLALKGKQPVFPVFIHGAPQQGESMVAPFMTFCRVRVIYGEQIDLSMFDGERMSADLLNRVTDLLMTKLAETGGQNRSRLSVVAPENSTARASA